MKRLLKEYHVKIEKVRALTSKCSYTVIMVNMKLLEVVPPTSIYHDCSTQKKFWEENFTGEEKILSTVNMKNCHRRSVRKHKEIKDSDNCVTLDISLKYDCLKKMKMTSSESKVKPERLGKG